jgi:bifunctional non-homologous end joining protein LigD
VVKALELLEVKSCLIDGELVVCDERGLAVFELLRRGMRIKPEAHLIAFDLLELDGRALAGKPIGLRKAEFARLLRRAGPGLQLCEHIDQPGDVVFVHACKLGCEGIVSKRLGSRYRPGPTKCPDWIKVKNPASPGGEFVSLIEVGERKCRPAQQAVGTAENAICLWGWLISLARSGAFERRVVLVGDEHPSRSKMRRSFLDN